MKIIKRNGAEAVFDIDKIVMAVTKANEATDEKVRMTPLQIQRISESVQISCEEMGRSPSVEEIQDLVDFQDREIRAKITGNPVYLAARRTWRVLRVLSGKILGTLLWELLKWSWKLLQRRKKGGG